MSNFNSKQIYEQLMGEHLPTHYNAETFTAYSNGRPHVGFKPYRGHKNPNGKWDVRTEGKDSYCQVRLAGYGLVWAALGKADHIELLGWGETHAYLSDFAPYQQAILREHRDAS